MCLHALLTEGVVQVVKRLKAGLKVVYSLKLSFQKAINSSLHRKN